MNLSNQPEHPSLSSSRFSFGLIGYPLGHSLSPRIHLAALQALGLDGEYNLYPIHPFPQGMDELVLLLDQIRSGRIHGLNVTIPHKQNVIPLLDDLTPEASAIGAVNTIYERGGYLVGDNTDAAGFTADLVEQFNPHILRPARVLIMGAGGSARSIAYALLSKGCHITIAARRIVQAKELRAQFPAFVQQVSIRNFEDRPLAPDDCSLIVNATSAGMTPNTAASPWPTNDPFPPRAVVYDLVYNPPETLLVKQARAAGRPAVTGLGMLVEQAALAFERWTGLDAPRQVMLESVTG